MKISIITLFPNMFKEVLETSIIGRAQKKNLIEIEYINLREFGEGLHQVVDGKPYGGGVGMVLRVDTLMKAYRSIEKDNKKITKTILMSASGKKFIQKEAKALSKIDHLIIICGHYEGIDQRFIDLAVDQEYSIGDFVLTGGEIPAMAVIDSVVRLIPNVLKKSEAVEKESFEDFEDGENSIKLLEHPHYTRPESFEGLKVPRTLTSGNHQEVEKWRKEKAIEKTKAIRPDLLN